MTPKQRGYYYTCNINDFEKQFRSLKIDNAKDYIDRSIAYLLKFGLANPKEPMKYYRRILLEVRKQVALLVARKQFSTDPKDLTNMHSKDNLEVQHFLANPVDYMVNKLKNDEYYNSIKPKKMDGLTDKEYEKFSIAYDNNKERLVKVMDTSTFKVRYNGNENSKLIAKDILDLLYEKMPDTSIPRELERGKPSFFEKFLFRTSRQFKLFKKTIIAFNLRKSPDSRDSKALEDTAMAYLRRKFPKLKEDELPTLEQISKLGPRSKVRATLCLNVVRSCREVKQADKLVTAVRALNLDPKELIKENPKPEKVVDVKSNEIKTEKKLKSAFRSKDKPKKSVKFNIEGKAQKRYRDENGRVVGGSGKVPKLPQEVRMKNKVVWEKSLVTEEEAILEEEALKKQNELDNAKPRELASDNNDFLKELKNDTSENVIDNNIDQIDTSSNKIEVAVENSK